MFGTRSVLIELLMPNEHVNRKMKIISVIKAVKKVIMLARSRQWE